MKAPSKLPTGVSIYGVRARGAFCRCGLALYYGRSGPNPYWCDGCGETFTQADIDAAPLVGDPANQDDAPGATS